MSNLLKQLVSLTPISRFQWLYAPTSSAVIFAVQTSLAALISLYIAFWMQLDSPYWAPITVWMIFVATPEENDSKAYWLVIGTLIGAFIGLLIIAAFPQQPALFGIVVALWVSSCCSLSCFLSNFRIHGLRMAAITGALVALDSVSNPNDGFNIAVSRACYVILGVFLQKLFASCFIGDRRQARLEWLKEQLADKVNKTCLIFSHFFAGDNENLSKKRSTFIDIYNLHQQTEFVDLAQVTHNRIGAHGRFITTIVNNILVKIYSLDNLLKTSPLQKELGDLPEKLSLFFQELPNYINTNQDVSSTVNKFEDIQRHFVAKINELYLTFLHTDEENKKKDLELHFTDCAMICDILRSIELLFKKMNSHTLSKSNFSNKIYAYKSFSKALYIGIRVFIAVIIGELVWEITAWDYGSLFILFICILASIIHLTDFPIFVSIGFLKGTCFAILVTGLINFVFIPHITNIEGLTYLLMIFMTISGLAVFSGVMRINTVAYNIFFFVLVQYNNQKLIDEVSYFNMSLCVLLSAAFMVITSFIIFPFSDKKETLFAAKKLSHNFKKLTHSHIRLPQIQDWVAEQSCNLVYILKHVGKQPQQVQDQFFLGALSTISIGEQIINVRAKLLNNDQNKSELLSLFNELCNKLSQHNCDIIKINDLFNKIFNLFEKQKNNDRNKIKLLASLCIIKRQLEDYQNLNTIVRKS